ncbi:YbfB/YjiJ family MFS transporter [Janthinobacterium sp. HLX7-2]|uniref:YbfB/YjiJ family MFS transporter n=1 Tax=Janthinobacterium sp. HLX7-2 TaxID=1259331 RepID=UPI003F1EDABB
MTTPILSTSMTTPELSPGASSGRVAVTVCTAAMISLAIAMGVGRFAFTPLFPLMVRDGLLNSEAGALLAASNYLGYLVGALVASRIRVKSATLLALGLISTVVVTAAVGWTSSVPNWAILRFAAGVMSAWTLVATSAWGLGWLASFGRPHLAGVMFAGVGLGIAAAGMFCLVVAGTEVTSLKMWVKLAFLASIVALFPLAVSRRLPVHIVGTGTSVPHSSSRNPPAKTGGLIVCYSLFGFGYILPATYLPTLARGLVDDPQVFGWAWPLFGMAAALSTVFVSWRLQRTNQLSVWAASHFLMAIGVLLPSIWASLISVAIAALLVGGTFMVITMLAMQEARARAEGDATVVLGQMTAGFAFGQLMGPVASAAIGRFTTDYSTALNYALELSAAGLLLSAFYLWREVRRHNFRHNFH